MESYQAFDWDSLFPLTQEYEDTYMLEVSAPIRATSKPLLATPPSPPSSGGRSGSSRKATSGKPLACKNCRRRKVKCHPSSLGAQKAPCRLCARVGVECVVPIVDERKLSNSRKLITQLYGRIAHLETELEEARLRPRGCASCGSSADTTNTYGVENERRRTAETHQDVSSPARSSRRSSNADDNMISRMCGGQHQLNADRAGRLRFFGPTSSLHLSESVVSSVLIGESYSSRGRHEWQDVLPRETAEPSI